MVSTHSPELLNSLDLPDIFWLAKRNGFSTVHRGADSTLLKRLVAEGDSPGALWRQGVFKEAWRE